MAQPESVTGDATEGTNKVESNTAHGGDFTAVSAHGVGIGTGTGGEIGKISIIPGDFRATGMHGAGIGAGHGRAGVDSSAQAFESSGGSFSPKFNPAAIGGGMAEPGGTADVKTLSVSGRTFRAESTGPAGIGLGLGCAQVTTISATGGTFTATGEIGVGGKQITIGSAVILTDSVLGVGGERDARVIRMTGNVKMTCTGRAA
jgi:hypothetical protein